VDFASSARAPQIPAILAIMAIPAESQLIQSGATGGEADLSMAVRSGLQPVDHSDVGLLSRAFRND
jgi:hypothetical protein